MGAAAATRATGSAAGWLRTRPGHRPQRPKFAALTEEEADRIEAIYAELQEEF